MSKAIISSILSKYFINYSSDKVKLSLMKGAITFDNLIMNKKAMDELFDKLNLPFVFRFGMVKTLLLDLKYLKATIEQVVIEDMILIVGPDATMVDRNFDVTEKQKLDIIKEMLSNLFKYNVWRDELRTACDELKEHERKERLKQVPMTLKHLALKKAKKEGEEAEENNE